MEQNVKIIAVTGKGGVGKTSLSAVIVKLLTEVFPDKRILAIDADPAVGLATALGIEVKSTVDDIRKEFINNVETGNTNEAVEMLGNARYKIFDTLIEQPGFSFLAIGRPESAGCYCKVNSYLKEVIKILAENYDYIVIDGEAGIEQVNRRVMEKVTHLLLVSDASKKGIQVIETINSVAKELMMYDAVGAIINRIPGWDITQHIDTGDIPVLAYIPSDEVLATCDIKGENIMLLPDNALIVQGAREALVKINILKG
ncbi:AAA family ATPase [Clostridium sp.]|uniref:ATP-binding protein n=1 Tax=Clostridium sp. TaxID=1506 RepID=UPI003D6D2BDD